MTALQMQVRAQSHLSASSSACRLFCRSSRNPSCVTMRPCSEGRAAHRTRRHAVTILAEKKEYYDFKDMPPLPLTVSRIYVPKLDYTVVSKQNEGMRMASLAIFYDIYKDEQYKSRLTRKSAMTALCMYDRDDVQDAQNSPGEYPNIDLLFRVYNQGMDLEFVVDEFMPK
ncbi:hypothetical protein Vafri_5653 [Volvox africanus]|uniref:Uncharacterized protein n=1 Tax=Volvox africanus TaxID=51714 RepID=A0A8J4B0F6_9CHLO|nr:hypothetical protein Vafri_5653 [Volvox africanus]